MLDPKRQQHAAKRARAAAAEQDYHERQAAGAKALKMSICLTWKLDPETFEPLPPEE